ncbi:glycosyltransferase family 2 protein [Moniliophthora roreri]|nr:glycosyltransferase family 2 protein [Moniliophthora roreri]
MQQTGEWIGQQLNIFLDQSAIVDRQETLQTLLRSQVIQLTSSPITFGILLPVTSRGSSHPSDCLHNLSQFTSSLLRTTHRDTRRTLCGQIYKVVAFLGIDHDDQFLLASEGAKHCRAEVILHAGGIQDVRTVICEEPRGHVCAIWRKLAEKAWNEGCDYTVLMGDDVVLRDDNWMSAAHKEFTDIAASRNLPHGFGCVAFTDISFPGMPTFPILHRTHLDIFKGKVVPDIFINQDGDPFLFQLYRRFGCSTMFSSTLSNGIGGEGAARYEKLHAKEWTFEPLDDATSEAQKWLADNHPESTIPGNTGERSLSKPDASRKITIDVVIPCYRVLVPILETILNLKSSPSCEVMFIVIIDNPSSPDIATLKGMFEHRPDIRIRVNEVNMGASESRNRGVRESAADWVHFLDDDIQPRPDLLFEAEKVIRKHPDAAGFVGNALFPVANTVFTMAVHLAGVTYFWDIANKIDTDLPWGVTANLITRRLKDGIEYDRIFPKTGGGEDIDYCRKKRGYSLQHRREAFFAAPEVVVTHPWWNEGKRSYWRFYMWSVGDGALIKLYPEHSYRDHTPNSAELILLCILGAAGAIVTRHLSPIFFVKALAATVLANVIHDCYRHLWRNPDRIQNMKSTIMGIWWVIAVIESSFIRMFSEIGRLRGLLGRREWMQTGKRFDWFAGRWGDGPMNEERLNGKQRFGLAAFLFLLISIL